MKMNGMKARFSQLAALGLVVTTMASPFTAFAAEPKSTDGNGNGVQSHLPSIGVDYQGFITTDDGNGNISGTWQDSNNEAATAQDYFKDGKVHLFYNTLEGIWIDPGRDPNKTSDQGDTDQKHANGTYIVTIPTKIAYDNMNVGKVQTSDDYTVNVRGAIKDGQTVTVRAETGNHLVNGSKTNEITETTKQGKTTWNSNETFNHVNPDGSLAGTDSKDNISLSGLVTTAGIYQGSVTYTAMLK